MHITYAINKSKNNYFKVFPLTINYRNNIVNLQYIVFFIRISSQVLHDCIDAKFTLENLCFYWILRSFWPQKA